MKHKVHTLSSVPILTSAAYLLRVTTAVNVIGGQKQGFPSSNEAFSKGNPLGDSEWLAVSKYGPCNFWKAGNAVKLEQPFFFADISHVWTKGTFNRTKKKKIARIFQFHFKTSYQKAHWFRSEKGNVANIITIILLIWNNLKLYSSTHTKCFSFSL